MPILLHRIDERLIHGQVVIGWGGELHPVRYLVVDDELAQSRWERELYELGLPEGVTGEFATVAEAREAWPAWQADEARSVLLTRNPETMLGLARGGVLDGVEINVGGLHHQPGRDQVLAYLYLDQTDREHLSGIRQEGGIVTARDLPGSAEVPLSVLLRIGHP